MSAVAFDRSKYHLILRLEDCGGQDWQKWEGLQLRLP
jgi:hypothetical protein